MLEREIKFRIPEERDPAAVREAIESAGFRLESSGTVAHEDRYLDTEDWLLYRAGIALRLRREGARLRLEAKSVRSQSEDSLARIEWAQEAPAADPPWTALPDGPVAALLQPLARLRVLERLRVRARIESERQQFRWLQGDEVLGSVTLDRVREPGSSNGGTSYRELEVELGGGAREALGEVRAAVEGRLGLTTSVETKLAAALAAEGQRLPERDEHEWALGPADRVVDVAVKTIGRHFTRMLWNEPGTRLGVDPDYVHDMRVATRRLRTALDVFADSIPGPAREDFERELQWAGRVLGRVRDLDVGLERVAAMAAETTKEERAALRILARDLELRRARRRVRLLERLDSDRYEEFVERARAWLKAGPQAALTPGSASALTPAYMAGARIVAEWDQKMRAAYEAAQADPSTENVHALRIAAKRARYAVEYFVELLGPGARDRVKRLARLQDFLGARQDAVMLLRRTRKYAKTIPHGDRELTLGAGAVLGQLARESRVKRGELRAAWGATEEGGASPEAR